MSDRQCPVCESQHLHSFWFWEKEDQLLREWAMDTRLHFSICRDCSSIFQNPIIPRDTTTDFDFSPSDFDLSSPETPPVLEPIEWVRQFAGYGRQAGKALEIFSEKKTFDPFLPKEGWDYEALSITEVINQLSTKEIPSQSESYDLIFCFDALECTPQPIPLLQSFYSRLKPDGALYLEAFNPLAHPRTNHLCLTRNNFCLFPFQSLLFALYKTGFTNHSAEICGRIRMLCTKMPQIPESEATKLVPTELWGHILYRFQRNFYWSWVTKRLQQFIEQSPSDPQLLEKTRKSLHESPLELHTVRDVCGACLLFVEEVANLRKNMEKDWPLVMARIFDVFKNDFNLYDLLQLAPLEGVGTFPDIERFHYNEKMIYMNTTEYFQKHFSLQEATKLCDTIIAAGQKVCGHLSSFL